MIYQIVTVLLLLIFYTFYIAKLVIQKKQSIKTNQMGTGNKPKNVLMIERIMSVATILVIVAEVGRVFLVKNYLPLPVRIAGLVLGASGVLFFAMATITIPISENTIPMTFTTLTFSLKNSMPAPMENIGMVAMTMALIVGEPVSLRP